MDITKTFFVRTNSTLPYDIFKQDCAKIGIVKETKFKNSFILKLGIYTIRCSKGGSFTFTGLIEVKNIVNILEIIFRGALPTSIYIVPAMHNLKKVYAPINLDLVMVKLNEGGDDFFAYKLPKSPGLNIKHKISLDDVPVTAINYGVITYGTFKEANIKKPLKPSFVTISLFSSGKAIFSGPHKVVLDKVITEFDSQLKRCCEK